MILSKQTIEILKNLMIINESILIEEGNTIRSISPSESILVRADVIEKFPREFGIAEIKKFLAIITSSDSELEFALECLKIKQKDTVILYSYCDPSSFTNAKNRYMSIDNPLTSFIFSEELFKRTIRLKSILMLNEIAITGFNGKLAIEAISSSNQLSDKVRTEIGETNENFCAIIDASLMVMMPQNYKVTLQGGKKPVVEFVGMDIPITYWVMLSTESHFE